MKVWEQNSVQWTTINTTMENPLVIYIYMWISQLSATLIGDFPDSHCLITKSKHNSNGLSSCSLPQIGYSPCGGGAYWGWELAATSSKWSCQPFQGRQMTQKQPERGYSSTEELSNWVSIWKMMFLLSMQHIQYLIGFHIKIVWVLLLMRVFK